ncbi:hypothetical protein EJB05_45018, partial [Eragrostis curvula]
PLDQRTVDTRPSLAKGVAMAIKSILLIFQEVAYARFLTEANGFHEKNVEPTRGPELEGEKWFFRAAGGFDGTGIGGGYRPGIGGGAYGGYGGGPRYPGYVGVGAGGVPGAIPGYVVSGYTGGVPRYAGGGVGVGGYGLVP